MPARPLPAPAITPIACDNLVYGHPWAVQWGPLEQGDIADRPWLDSAHRAVPPLAVMHFAAYAYVGESVQDPGKYYRNNVVGTLTLLEAMRDHGISRLIFSSTCATYGVPQAIPIPETHPQAPINPYGASKLMIERMLGDFDVAHGLRSVALRYFNAAGADPDGEVGESHDPETHLIPLVLEAAARAPAAYHGLRRGLRHAGRHLHPGLHPRSRPGGRPCPCPSVLGGGCPEHGLQPWERAGFLRPRGDRACPAGHGKGDPGGLWSATCW